MENVEYRVVHLSMSENERAIMMEETAGSVKLLIDTQDNMLGVHILAAEADNIIAPFVVAMQANIPTSTLASSILPYPTLSEVALQAVNKLYQ